MEVYSNLIIMRGKDKADDDDDDSSNSLPQPRHTSLPVVSFAYHPEVSLANYSAY